MISWVSSIKKAESLGHVVYSSRYKMLLTSGDGSYICSNKVYNKFDFSSFFSCLKMGFSAF